MGSRYFLFFFLSYLSLHSTALASDSLRWEKKFQLASEAWKNGEYAQVLDFTSQLITSSPIEEAVLKAKVLKAKALFAVRSFQESYRLAESMERDTLTSLDPKRLWQWLADYYSYTRQYVKLGSCLQKFVADSCSSDLLFHWIHYAISTGRMNEADRLLQMVQKRFLVSKVDPRNQANYYVWRNFYRLKNGQWAKGDSISHAELAWFQMSGKVCAEHHSKYLELEAERYLLRENNQKALSHFELALSVFEVSEYHIQKIYLLLRITCLSKLLGNQIAYDSYMRRLQLHADRSLDKYNYFQLAFKLAESYALSLSGNYTQAESHLNAILSKYPQLPSLNCFSVFAVGLKEQIYRAPFRIDRLRMLADSMENVVRPIYGAEAPELLTYKVSRINLETQAGLKFAENEMQLQDAIRSIADKYVGEQSLLMYRLWHALMKNTWASERFQQAYIHSEKLILMARELFSVSSLEYVQQDLERAYLAYWSGQYSVAIRCLQELKNHALVLKTQGSRKTQGYCYGLVFQLSHLLGKEEEKQIAGNILFKRPSQQWVLDMDEEAEAAQIIGRWLLGRSNLYLAEKYFTEAYKQKVAYAKEEGLVMASIRMDKIELAMVNGDFGAVDQLLNQYQALASKVNGTKSLLWAQGLVLRARYFESVGDFAKAKEILSSGLLIYKQVLGEKHLALANLYVLLARWEPKLKNKKPQVAESLFIEAGEIIERSLGKNNSVYVNYLINFSEYLTQVGNYPYSERVLKAAEVYFDQNASTKSTLHALWLMHWGHLHYAKELYVEAQLTFKKAAVEWGALFSEEHSSYCLAISFEARSLYMQGKGEEAIDKMNVIMPVYLTYIEQYFPFLGFAEKEKYWNSIKEQFEFYNFICLIQKEDKKSLNALVYSNVIQTKAILLSSDIKLRKKIAASGDTVLHALFLDWVAQKQRLTSSLALTREELKEQGIDLKVLQGAIEALEKSMSLRSLDLSKELKHRAVSWSSVRDVLKPNEYALEMVRSRYFDKVFQDSVLYAALLLGSNDHGGPQKVLFPNGNDMETRKFKYYKNAIRLGVTDKVSHSVYWKVIKEQLADKSLVYFSADGVYCQLNVEQFYNPETERYVFDELRIVLVTNTKDLIPVQVQTSKKVRAPATPWAVLGGNPAFYTQNYQGDRQIEPLPGAGREVDVVNQILTKYGSSTTMIIGDQLTEDTLMQLKSPTVLHIATHGYFYERANTSDTAVLLSNPLLYSGLLLKGSGELMAHKEYSFVNSKSGILTAYEAINLTLENTQLVVLSACQTGEGEVQSGEGVMGLQRSFLVAGASCVVVSLFKVNDEVTYEMMQNFYEFWQGGMSKREAFHSAKMVIKSKYPSPKHWGVFVMIEGKPI